MKIFLYFTFFLLFLSSCNNASIESSFTSLDSSILNFQNIDSTTVINPNNKANFPISGTCQSSAGVVTLSIQDDLITKTLDCTNNQFSSTVDLSSIPNGSVKIIISQMDPVSHQKNSFLLTLSKSSLPVAILSGSPTSVSNLTTLDVTVSGTDLTYYKFKVVDSTSDCSSSSNYSASEIAVGTNITASISGLLDGIIKVCAVGRDDAGNYQEYSSATSTSWTKDTTAPIIGFSGAPSGISSTTTLNISLNGTDVTYYKYKVGDSTLDCSSSIGYSVSEIAVGTNITASISGLGDGTIKVCAVGRDAAGNYQAYSSATSTSWTKDTTPPSIGFSGAPMGTNSTTTLNISLTGADVTFYKYKVGDSNLDCSLISGYPASEIAVGTNITDSISGLGDGTIKVCAVGRDATGNYQEYSSATSTSWTKDTTAPIIGFSGAPIGTNSTTTLNISLTGTDVTYYKYKVGISTLDCSLISGYSASEVAVGTNITDSISGLGDGIIKVCAVGRDAAGNYQPYPTATSTSWTKDTTAPSKPTVLSLLSPSTSPNTVSQPTISIGGVVAGETVKLYKNDNTCLTGLAATGTVAASQITIGLQLSSALTDGSNTFYATSTDPLGNTSSCSTASVVYVLDTVAPTAPTGIPSLGSTSAPSNETPILSWTTSTDNGGSGVASYQVQIFNSSNVAVGSPAAQVSGNKITGLSLTDGGTYYVKISAIDNAGNISTESYQSSYWTATAAVLDPCSAPTPAIGTLCTDGTYYVGTITIGGDTYKLATTPGGCGYEPGGSAISSPTNYFTPTCNGTNDTMKKNLTTLNPVTLADQVQNFTDKSTITGSVSTQLVVASPQDAPSFAYCNYMNYANHNDWFLPNKSELHMMACHGTTTTNPLPGTSEDIGCLANGYGTISNKIPNFNSGSGHAVSFSIYASSTTPNYSASNLIEQTVNSINSGIQTLMDPGTQVLVRCARIIN